MTVKKLLAAMLLVSLVLGACGTQAPAAPDVAEGYTGTVVKSVPQDLIDACKKEGMVTIIATPPDWANYGEIFADFQATTGVKINSLDPNAGSADEYAAIEANKDNKGPQAPDIVDVGYAYGQEGIDKGILQPYKVSTWDKIPATLLGLAAKDPDGFWTGGYYGVMAMLANTDAVKNVPANWEDLLKPEYTGQVALSGDPRSSNQAIQTVFAASTGQRRFPGRRSARAGLLQGDERCRQLRPGDRQAWHHCPGRNPDRLHLGLLGSGLRQRVGREPQRRDRLPLPDDRQHVCPGDQRLCAASQLRQGVDGNPPLR